MLSFKENNIFKKGDSNIMPAKSPESNKEMIIMQYKRTIESVEKLVHLSEEQWRSPIDEHGRTIAEIIGHLIPWDEYVINERIPVFKAQIGDLPRPPQDDVINTPASIRSKTESKDTIIKSFITVRESLIELIKELDEKLWRDDVTFSIGKSILTLHQYFSGLIEHDLLHFKEIENAIK